MAMTYSQWLAALLTIIEQSDASGATAFDAVVARCIASAELRMYREFDFLYTRNVDLSKLTIGGIRAVSIPSQFVVVEGISLLLPAGGHNPTDLGVERLPLTRTSRQYLDIIWPVETQVATPDPLYGGYWALFSEQQVVGEGGSADELTAFPSAALIAPTPDDEYRVEFTGTIRPAPLSVSNTTTFLTAYMDDIFLAATLKWAFAYQRDFGAASNDPQASLNWEQEYRILAAKVDEEELRKKAAITGFSPMLPATTFPSRPVAPQVSAGPG